MNPDTAKQIIDALKPVADKLGQGAGHLYEVYVRQMLVEGWTTIAILAILWIIFIAFSIFTWKFARKHWSSSEYEGPMIICIASAAILGSVLITVTPFLVFETATKLINPEYAAIDRLITTVHGDSR